MRQQALRKKNKLCHAATALVTDHLAGLAQLRIARSARGAPSTRDQRSDCDTLFRPPSSRARSDANDVTRNLVPWDCRIRDSRASILKDPDVRTAEPDRPYTNENFPRPNPRNRHATDLQSRRPGQERGVHLGRNFDHSRSVKEGARRLRRFVERGLDPRYDGKVVRATGEVQPRKLID